MPKSPSIIDVHKVELLGRVAAIFGLLLVFNSFSQAQFQTSGPYPFVPIYSEGDDISHANPKPRIIYKEVAGTKVEIPNMPAIKMQSELGECRAFSVAALMQWYACSKDKDRKTIQNCNNPPPEWSISYFGMMMYTQQDLLIDKTLQIEQDRARGMYKILNEIQSDGGKFILESCKPYHVMTKNFSLAGATGLGVRDSFFRYLKALYEKSNGEANDACPDCISYINSIAGLNVTQETLSLALAEQSYDKFLYSIFFTGCKFKRFPVGYQAMVYPEPSQNVSRSQLKKKVIEVLREGKPVLYPNLCLRFENNYCKQGHSVVISGYRQLTASLNGQRLDVFKIHNSWGAEWQRLNNDGWVDADRIIDAVHKGDLSNALSVSPQSVLWLL